MSMKNEGVAPAKDTTPIGRWLDAADANVILAERGDRGELTPREAALALAVGLPLTWILMFCAAAI